MLNFLDNKSANRITVKPLVKYQPSLIYGHTEESPTYFINPHTIYYQGSAKENPIQTKLKAVQQFPQINPSKKLKLKRNASTNIDELMITNSDKKGVSQELAKRLSHPDIISSSNFNITNGEFSNFLDKHKHHNDMGVIYKEKNSFNSTQKIGNSQSLSKMSWNKSINTESKSNFSNSLYKPKLTIGSQKQATEKDSILQSHPRSLWMTRSNSVSIFEKAIPKAQIRYRREEFIDNMKKEVSQRLQTKYSNFGLPKLGVEHELFLLQKKKLGKNEVKKQMDEINQDLSKFQKNLFVRLK